MSDALWQSLQMRLVNAVEGGLAGSYNGSGKLGAALILTDPDEAEVVAAALEALKAARPGGGGTATLRAALATELVAASAVAGRDVGLDAPSAFMVAWAAGGKANIVWGGRPDVALLERIAAWCAHAVPAFRARRGGDLVERIFRSVSGPPKGAS